MALMVYAQFVDGSAHLLRRHLPGPTRVWFVIPRSVGGLSQGGSEC
ncbi:hypothetical protein [Mycobacterium canetti]|nr:hypothetical protein [Mycobacterium canetti]